MYTKPNIGQTPEELLKQGLKHGDRQEIAKRLGVTAEHIRRVLSHKEPNYTDERVIETALSIIKERTQKALRKSQEIRMAVAEQADAEMQLQKTL
ncbi:MAG: hypothetical protein RJQ09_21440 [Cyclobacteriaceae bacterium]